MKNDRFKEARTLDLIVCGGVWTESRKGDPLYCITCGSNNTTMYHRYWSCPALTKHSDEAIRSTQWMRRLFDQQHAKYECWWGRAILPADFAPTPHRKAADDFTTTSTPDLTKRVEELRPNSGRTTLGSQEHQIHWRSSGNYATIERAGRTKGARSRHFNIRHTWKTDSPARRIVGSHHGSAGSSE